MKREVRRIECRPPLNSGGNKVRTTHHAPRVHCGFTLIELLVVIAIMGILAAIAMPAINKLKPNVMAAGTQKLLADVGRARQLAIAHHTTVFMVFVPPGYWNDLAYSALSLDPNPTNRQANLQTAQSLADKQMVGYNFVTTRSIGDQPGRSTVRYLDAWRSLPEGVFIPWQMFDTNSPISSPLYFYTNSVNGPGRAVFANLPPGQPVPSFTYTNGIPFPTETAWRGGQPGWINVPFIAFNYLGQLAADASGKPLGRNVFIPLSQGSVQIARDANKVLTPLGPTVAPAVGLEKPVGNTTNAFNVINIDWLTGRARVERQEVL